METMSEGRLTKRINMGEVDKSRGKDKPIRRWSEVVKEVVEQRGLSYMENERQGKDGIKSAYEKVG